MRAGTSSRVDRSARVGGGESPAAMLDAKGLSDLMAAEYRRSGWRTPVAPSWRKTDEPLSCLLLGGGSLAWSLGKPASLAKPTRRATTGRP
jgi:hypothetical protein